MIKVLSATPNPIQFMGKVAGVCYNSDIENGEKNYKRGLKNIKDNHGRVMEYVDIVVEVDGYSARTIRQIYTHVAGTSRLSASTRYIDYSGDNFIYYTPKPILENKDALHIYDKCMDNILENYNTLLNMGIDKEDVANILPLGLNQKMVLKINFRALLHLAEMRLCERAYEEVRDFVKELINVTSDIDEEWAELMKFMLPKCKTCTDKENCPRLKNKGDK